MSSKSNTEKIIQTRQLWYDLYENFINPDQIAAIQAYQQLNKTPETEQSVTKAVTDLLNKIKQDYDTETICYIVPEAETYLD